MFGENQRGSFDLFMNDYMKDGGLYGREAFGMNEETFEDAMDIFKSYLTKEKPESVKDNRSTRLTKGQECPVCDHKISQESNAYGGREFTNKCQKCGLTDESSNWGTVHQLSLEEFRWAYQSDENADANATEEKVVISIYRKIWSGVELTEQEESELEAIALSQKVAMGV